VNAQNHTQVTGQLEINKLIPEEGIIRKKVVFSYLLYSKWNTIESS